ncbi:hypothetical protein QF035_007715 [Streptomyces umbrinus]|uniref:Uncharacterized protein n=1 Tax=Streptomyces umbrinus TaxID=67370 RepID=A0ABU0T2T9_9ACTN|nr:hypothetical protein [Streptomyces umbrinus]
MVVLVEYGDHQLDLFLDRFGPPAGLGGVRQSAQFLTQPAVDQDPADVVMLRPRLRLRL